MFRGILAFCFNNSITQKFNPFKCCLWNNSMLLQTVLKDTQVSYIVCSKENDHLRIRRQKQCIISQGGTSAERTQSTHSLSFNAFSKHHSMFNFHKVHVLALLRNLSDCVGQRELCSYEGALWAPFNTACQFLSTHSHVSQHARSVNALACWLTPTRSQRLQAMLAMRQFPANSGNAERGRFPFLL